MKIPVISAIKGAVVRSAILAFAVTLAALVQPLHGLGALVPAPTEAAAVARALPTVSAAHRHDDCDPAPKPAAALCAVSALLIPKRTEDVLDVGEEEAENQKE